MTPKKGNKNAYKHGIYTKFIAVADDKMLIKMKKDSNVDELANARVRLKHAMENLQNAADDESRLKWDFSCRHWTEIIDNMVFHNVNRTQTEVQIFETLIDAIRAANDKQNVQR